VKRSPARGVGSPHPLANSLGTAQASMRLLAQWKTPRRRRAALLQHGCVHNWLPTRPEVVVAPGTWPAPKQGQQGFPMRTFGRSVFLHCSKAASVTSRTAVCGPVCTVVWQGLAGDCRPYADQTEKGLQPGHGKPVTRLILLLSDFTVNLECILCL
jgi:hypothetical protein